MPAKVLDGAWQETLVALQSLQQEYAGLAAIESFRHKGLKRFYEKDERKGVPPEVADKVARILARLDLANSPEQMDLPGLKLHPLKGEPRGFWSVWVSGNWRIIFRFEGTDVAQVDLVDYH